MILNINPDLITHIKIYDLRKGVKYGYYPDEPYIYLPSRKKWKWFGFIPYIEKYVEGFYINGKYQNNYFNYIPGYSLYSVEEVEKMKGIIIVDSEELYTLPTLEIFIGEKLLKRLYFNSFKEALKFRMKNFPNVDVILED